MLPAEQGKSAEDGDRDDGQDDAVLGHRLPVFAREPGVELLHWCKPPETSRRRLPTFVDLTHIVRRRLRMIPRFGLSATPAVGLPACDAAALGAVAARVRRQRRRAGRLHLLPALEGADEDGLVVHRGERAFVLLNKFPYASGHLMVAPVRHVGEFGELDDDEALEIHRLAAQGMAALAQVVRAAGLQPRLEPRPHRRRGHRRPRPPARRPALGRRHELHAGARRREGAAGAPRRDAAQARRRLAGLRDQPDRVREANAARLSIWLDADQRAALDLVEVGDLERSGIDARLAHCFLQLRRREELAGSLG